MRFAGHVMKFREIRSFIPYLVNHICCLDTDDIPHFSPAVSIFVYVYILHTYIFLNKILNIWLKREGWMLEINGPTT